MRRSLASLGFVFVVWTGAGCLVAPFAGDLWWEITNPPIPWETGVWDDEPWRDTGLETVVGGEIEATAVDGDGVVVCRLQVGVEGWGSVAEGCPSCDFAAPITTWHDRTDRGEGDCPIPPDLVPVESWVVDGRQVRGLELGHSSAFLGDDDEAPDRGPVARFAVVDAAGAQVEPRVWRRLAEAEDTRWDGTQLTWTAEHPLGSEGGWPQDCGSLVVDPEPAEAEGDTRVGGVLGCASGLADVHRLVADRAGRVVVQLGASEGSDPRLWVDDAEGCTLVEAHGGVPCHEGDADARCPSVALDFEAGEAMHVVVAGEAERPCAEGQQELRYVLRVAGEPAVQVLQEQVGVPADATQATVRIEGRVFVERGGW